jgi:hypothetical protein
MFGMVENKGGIPQEVMPKHTMFENSVLHKEVGMQWLSCDDRAPFGAIGHSDLKKNWSGGGQLAGVQQFALQ